MRAEDLKERLRLIASREARVDGATPAQAAQRILVDERCRRLQLNGVRRGPLAAKDGTFGKVEAPSK